MVIWWCCPALLYANHNTALQNLQTSETGLDSPSEREEMLQPQGMLTAHLPPLWGAPAAVPLVGAEATCSFGVTQVHCWEATTQTASTLLFLLHFLTCHC